MEKIIQALTEWPFVDELCHETYGFLLEKQFEEKDK